MSAAWSGVWVGSGSHSVSGPVVVVSRSLSSRDGCTGVVVSFSSHSVLYMVIRWCTAWTGCGWESNVTSGVMLCNTSSPGTSSLTGSSSQRWF